MSDDQMEVCAWIHRDGWGVAHVLRPHSRYQFRGAEYARTQCGRNVRCDQIANAGYGDKCKRCTNIAVTLRAQARGTET